MSYTTPKHCIFCGDPTSLCRCPPEILEFARAHVVFTDDWRGIVSGDTLRVLIERAQEWGRIASSAARPEGLANKAMPSLEEVERTMKDAARYRWLRDECAYEAWHAYVVTPPAAMDAAIDKGMAASEKRRSPLAKHEEKP